jgi:hypothetical protein
VVVWLSGAITQTLLANPRPDVGLMLQPGMGNRSLTLPLAHWSFALDNACFAQGETFDAGAWLEWLAGLRRYRARCLFATAPDVFCDARATWERAAPYLATIRQLGYSAALVAQNGFDLEEVDAALFDVLFIGGDDRFKQAEGVDAARWARSIGKKIHLGRVNTLWRLRDAHDALYDSADGTYLKYGPDRNLPKIYDWLDEVNGRLPLEMMG